MKLEVAKTVVGEQESNERLFEFEIQIRQNGESEWSDPFVFELSHELAFEFTVPYGYQYRISEEDYSDEGYRTFVEVNGKRSDKLVCEGTMLFPERIEYINEKLAAEQEVGRTANLTESSVAFGGTAIVFFIIFALLVVKRKYEP